MPARWPSAEKSLWRRRKSAGPSFEVRNNSSRVECGDASTPKSPCSRGTRKSKACSQSTSSQWPSRFTIGRRSRSGEFSPSYEKRSLSESQHSFTRVVLERQHAHHRVLLHLHHQVRAERVVRRDRAAPRQLPGARLVAERLRGERADRAEVDHVAGELGLDRAADERHDLGVLAAPGEAELHDAADLLAEAHAARALDAAAHFLRSDQRAELFPEHDSFLFRYSASCCRRSRPRGPAAGIRRPGRRSGSRAGG